MSAIDRRSRLEMLIVIVLGSVGCGGSLGGGAGPGGRPAKGGRRVGSGRQERSSAAPPQAPASGRRREPRRRVRHRRRRLRSPVRRRRRDQRWNRRCHWNGGVDVHALRSGRGAERASPGAPELRIQPTRSARLRRVPLLRDGRGLHLPWATAPARPGTAWFRLADGDCQKGLRLRLRRGDPHREPAGRRDRRRRRGLRHQHLRARDLPQGQRLRPRRLLLAEPHVRNGPGVLLPRSSRHLRRPGQGLLWQRRLLLVGDGRCLRLRRRALHRRVTGREGAPMTSPSVSER